MAWACVTMVSCITVIQPSAQPSLPRGWGGVGWGSVLRQNCWQGPWSLVHVSARGNRPRDSKWQAGGCPARQWVWAYGLLWLWASSCIPLLLHPQFCTDGETTSGVPWGPRWLIKSMGFPRLYSWMGDGLPGWAASLGKVGLVRGPPGRGGEGLVGTEDGRAVSVRGRKPGGASPLRHVPPSPAGRSVSEGRQVDGVRWFRGGRNGATDPALR